MSNTQLYIPQKCKVGLQIRQDTYTGKLGYIIYNDGKVWRKEKSWEGWRHKEGKEYTSWDRDTREHQTLIYEGVEPIEFENVPTEGFVLNKKAGGTNSGWNHRQTYCRVYDPRGWEFEITIPNLLYILQECSAFKGKGLEGEFVYSWDGKDLVLLPVSSPDYIECKTYTDLQSQKVGKRDLVEGCTYITSKMEKLVYLGQHNVCPETYYAYTNIESEVYNRSQRGLDKLHVFRTENENVDEYSNVYVFLTSFSRLKAKLSDDIDSRFAEFIDELQKSEYFSEPDHLEVGVITKSRNRNDIFDYSWNTKIYKKGEIKTSSDLNELERVIRRTGEENKWEICVPKQVKRVSSYWSREDYFDTVYESEGLFTKDEIMENYGLLYRVYKNGFKKIV